MPTPVDRPYYRAPELGLQGRWPLEWRLAGLEPVVEACRDQTVLDLGCAEGLVALEFMRAGARLVHGFELDSQRVLAAQNACAQIRGAAFRQADLADWDTFVKCQDGHLLASYDLVLYLGLHHHLPEATRGPTLFGAASLSAAVLAMRMPSAVYDSDRVEKNLEVAGFTLFAETHARPGQDMGSLWLFRRSVAE